MNWFAESRGSVGNRPSQEAWEAYQELFPESREESPPHISDFPIYMTPMEIRSAFQVPNNMAVLGVSSDENGWDVQAKVLRIERGESLLLKTSGIGYKNGPVLLSLLRSLLRTHRDRCEVFGYGEMKAHFPQGQLEMDTHFVHAGGGMDGLEGFLDDIENAMERGKVPVLVMDLIHRAERAWGSGYTLRGDEQTSIFDAFLSKKRKDKSLNRDQLLLVGSIGGIHSHLSNQVTQHFKKIFEQNPNHETLSPYDLAYWDPSKKRHIHMAANKYVQAYQSYGQTTLDTIAGSQFDEAGVEYDD